MPLKDCFSCLWFPKEAAITELDFTSTIVPDIFAEVWQHERTLEKLILTSTRIKALPPQLFYCQSLRVLVLNSNSLDVIPNAIGSLSHLQHLNLSHNFICTLPPELKACKSLTHLDLSCNSLQRVPDVIPSIISLQELFLNETYLEFLPANFGRLVNLRILELRLNSLISIPKSILRLTNLQRLDIGGNEFTELPETVGELKQLRELWVDFNQIRKIHANIGKLKELRHFEANGNLLDSLPNEMSMWGNIEVLSVCTNMLQSLPFNFGLMKSLVSFKCESNELTSLPDSISGLENLEELVVSHNRLASLPATIGVLRKLRFLFADDNELAALPDEISSCSNLSILSVSRNRIRELPQDIGHLTNLKVLNVVSNQIATLPVSVLSLVNLTSFWINDNQSQPLVPLQYINPNTKTHLTCVMLPQTGASNELRQHLNDTSNSSVYAHTQYNDSTAQGGGGDDQSRLYASTKSPDATCYETPSRRICFAEEATVLSAGSAQPHPQRVNYHNDSEPQSPTVTYNPVEPVDDKDLSVRLLRSPTPYPKELRMMAKYVRNMQKIPAESSEMQVANTFNVKEARVVVQRPGGNQPMWQQYDAASPEPLYATQQQVPPPRGTFQDPSQMGVGIQEDQMSLATLSSNVQYMAGQMNGLPPENGNISNTDAAYQRLYLNANNIYESSGGANAYARRDLDAQSITSSNNNKLQAEPPPYHIARNYTKKTAEELTTYNAIRNASIQQQREPDYVERLQQQQQQQREPDYVERIQQQQREAEYIESLQQQHQREPDYVERLDNANRSGPPPQGAYDYQLRQDQSNPYQYEAEQRKSYSADSTDGLEVMQHMASYAASASITPPTPATQQVIYGRTITPTPPQGVAAQTYHQTVNPGAPQIFVATSYARPITPTASHTFSPSANQAQNPRPASYARPITPTATQNLSPGVSASVGRPTTPTSMQNASQASPQSPTKSIQSQGNASQTRPQTASPTSSIQNQRAGSTEGRRSGGRTPWMFGVHKNPTVKQISLKWDNDVGFSMKKLPNQEGLFVASTAPNTNASKLLQAGDKLLEIDGNDVTTMDLQAAYQLLATVPNTMNIMLSRK